MQLIPADMDAASIYSMMIRAISPRPIAWVSTVSPSGVPNLAPFSYFNGVGSQPAALMFSVVNHPDGRPKDTLVNIEATGEFVVNLVPFELAGPMVATSAGLDYEVSEFSAAGLTPRSSTRVGPPAVSESPVQFECELLERVRVGEGPLAANVVIGQILLVEIDPRVLDDQQELDPGKLDMIGRLGGREYCRTTDPFQVKAGNP